MRTLDDGALESVAELICGGDGACNSYSAPGPYRSMGRIGDFFSRAKVRPQGQHGTRKWFVKESLQAINGTDALERVILRLASPREYRNNNEMFRAVLARLNEILQLEGLEILLVGVDPQFRRREASAPLGESGKKSAGPPPDFSRMVGAGPLADILAFRWEEARRCESAEAHLSAVVMMGSILEGALLFKVERNPSAANCAKAAPKKADGKTKPFREWGLSALIDVAHETGWLQVDVTRFSHALRESRNIVHPFMQRAQGGETPDGDTCAICWEVVKAAVADLMTER